jgi:hypothetical protein
MPSNNDAHHLEVENNKTPGLPNQVPPPEAGCPGRNWWIGFIVITSNYIFHGFCFNGCLENTIRESATRMDIPLPCE